MSERARQYSTDPDDYPESLSSSQVEQEAARLRAVGDKTAEYRDKVSEVVDKTREHAASSMELIADRLHQQSANSDGLQAGAAEKVAAGVDTTAEYLKEGDTRGVIRRMKSYVRSHPLQAVGVAIVAALVIGRLLTR